MSDHEKPHISSTQHDMICNCPEAYRRRYMEGEKIPPGIAAVQGRATHKGAEENFRQKIDSHRDLPKDEIVEIAAAVFDNEVNQGGFLLTEEELSIGTSKVLGAAKDKTVEMAEAHAVLQAPEYQPVAVEISTRIILPNASRDLLAITDLRDDQGRVIDLKTSARRKPQSEADGSVQLTIYAAAFVVDNKSLPNELRLDRLVKTKRVSRQVLKTHRSTADFMALTNRVNVIIRLIEAGIFIPCPPGHWKCNPKWCGYWSTCPYINSERRAAAEATDNGD